MRAFFVSPSPRFKSYKQPDKAGIEESPYFWWWYALTLNSDYSRLCQQMKSGSAKAPQNAAEQKMLDVYNDWGDVRYQGDHYIAFTKWFTRAIGNGQTVGSRLFAERPLQVPLGLVQSGAAAEAALANGSAFLIAIPKNVRREYVDKRLDAILKKYLGAVKGRAVRDPSTSSALYHLTKAAVPKALKAAFDLYDAKLAAEAAGEKAANNFLFKRVGLPFKQRTKDEVPYSLAEKRRVISMLVSRHIANAKTMIKNAGLGQFP